MNNLNVIERDDQKRALGQLHNAVCRGLHVNVRPAWHAEESQIADWNVKLQIVAAAGVFDLLCERQEQLVEFSTAASLLLFLLEFLFVTVAMFPLPIAGFIELHVGGLAIELHVLGLLLANHDWVDEVQMDDDDQLVLAWLEEQVLDVVEQQVDLRPIAAVDVPYTVLVDLHRARNSLAVQRRTQEYVIQNIRATVYWVSDGEE